MGRGKKLLILVEPQFMFKIQIFKERFRIFGQKWPNVSVNTMFTNANTIFLIKLVKFKNTLDRVTDPRNISL